MQHHACGLESHVCAFLYIELTVVKANPTTGAVDDQEVVSALRPNTILVSIMLANNETGVIQPVEKIAGSVRRWQREIGGKNKVFVHTDAAQVCTTELVVCCFM